MKPTIEVIVNSIQLQYDFMAPALVALFETEKEQALESEEKTNVFLEKATDIEALAVLSELSLQAPLNHESYRMMMHLSFKVFTAAGVQNIPDFIQEAQKLSSFELHELEGFKRKIRERQLKKRRKTP